MRHRLGLRFFHTIGAALLIYVSERTFIELNAVCGGGAVCQRVDGRGALLKTHKYSIGQNVRYTAGPFGRFGASGSFKIVKLLPPEGDELQYRIKCAGEAFERVAKESQLDRDR